MGTTLWLARAACLLYLIGLTTLLVVPDPLGWLLWLAPDASPPGHGVHFAAFFLLALLTAASRPRWPAAVLASVLVAYAVAIESLQFLVESRTVEAFDYAENLFGLAAGVVAWRLGARLCKHRAPSGRNASN